MRAPLALVVARRDIAAELAGRELAVAAIPFVTAAALLAGVAFGPRPDVLTAVGPGLVWVLVLFAAVPLSRGSATAEREEGCWDLLRGLVPPAALLAGKTLGLWLWLLVVWAVSALLVAGLFDAPPRASALAAAPLGTLGLAALAVVLGVTVSSRPGGERLVAILVLPAGLPVLLAGAQAGLPNVDALPWLALMAGYDAVALTVAWAVFPILLEE